MLRIATTLTVIALLFSAGSAWADDNSEANELFVEAVKLVNLVENIEGFDEKAVVLEEVLGKLNEIIDNYPSSDLAVKLISNQAIGDISLGGVTALAERAKSKAEKTLAFDLTLEAAEGGDPEAQYNVGRMIMEGEAPSWDYTTALEWYYKAALQGHRLATSWLVTETAMEISEIKAGLSKLTKKGHSLREAIREAFFGDMKEADGQN